MRRTIYSIMLAITAAICATIIVVAFTNVPPEPYVRRVSDRPQAPVQITRCEQGEVVIHYTTGRGEQLEPVATGQAC